MTSLKNGVSDNSNINLNGHKLYVNGEIISTTNYNDSINNSAIQNETDNKNNNLLLIILITAVILLAAIILIILISKNKKKQKYNALMSFIKAPPSSCLRLSPL